jgi:hypothetical protein
VDISKFVRRSFPDEDLYNYVSKDDGGFSVDTLEKLLDPFHVSSATIVACDSGAKVHEKGYNLNKLMRDYGPGLVHNFKTHKNFNGKKHPACATGYLQFNGPRNARGQFVEVLTREDIEIELESFLNDGTECSAPQPRNLANDGFPAPTSTSAKSARETQDSSETGNDRKKGKESEKSTHAMLLIGGHLDKKGKIWLFCRTGGTRCIMEGSLGGACDGIMDGDWAEGILDGSLKGILDGTCKGILEGRLRWHHGWLLGG